ncbi:MAG: hypothetical protein RLZZ608_91 [Actinomycetota bacterium]|jgi:hypothetical protein
MLSRILPVALIATLALSACAAPAPVASPSAAAASSSSAPSPTSTPEPEPVPAELVVLNVGVQLYDSAGTEIGAFAWADEAPRALEVLELAFGAPVSTGLIPGEGAHTADYETYTFEGGVTYYTAINLEKPRNEFHAPSIVRVDPSTDDVDVTIRTPQGLEVGGTQAEVLALSPVANRRHMLGTVYLIDPVDPSLVSAPEDSTDTIGIIVDAGGVIVQIMTPFPTNPL